jgi:hypothetical protein
MMYNVTLETSGLKFKAKGETVLEALDNLGITWEKVKAKGVITISQGKKSLDYLFILFQLKRIFANKYNRLLWSNRLEKLFKAKYAI